jgi:hypothetical protein
MRMSVSTTSGSCSATAASASSSPPACATTVMSGSVVSSVTMPSRTSRLSSQTTARITGAR